MTRDGIPPFGDSDGYTRAILGAQEDANALGAELEDLARTVRWARITLSAIARDTTDDHTRTQLRPVADALEARLDRLRPGTITFGAPR